MAGGAGMLEVVQTFTAAALAAIRGDSRLLITGPAASGGGGGGGSGNGMEPELLIPELLIIDPVGGQQAAIPLAGSGIIAPAAITTTRLTARNGLAELSLGPDEHRLPAAMIAALTHPPDGAGVAAATTLARLDAGGRAGGRVVLLQHEGRLIVGNDGGVTIHDATTPGWPQLGALARKAVPGLGGITALAALGNRIIVAAEGEVAFAVLDLDRNGRPGLAGGAGSMVAAGDLPLNQPSALVPVTLNGRQFVVATARASSSVSVLELLADGSLRLRDQIIDNRHSRFAGAAALDAIVIGDQALVAVAGTDGGVTLLQLLPDGRLLTRAVLGDAAPAGLHPAGLHNVTDLQFVVVGDAVELFALATGAGAVTRLRVDPALFGPASIGITATATRGTARNDILTAPDQGGQITGGAGADILIAGPGRDTLTGGKGPDLFVLGPDHDRRDVIANFTPGEDFIDLSAFPRLHSLAAIGITLTASGAELAIGPARITIKAGRRLTLAEVQAAIRLDTDRVVLDVPAPLGFATPGNDPAPRNAAGDFIWQAGPLIYGGGGSGTTVIDYSAAPAGVVADLSAPGRNGGAATGHVLRGITDIIGSRHDDRLIGDARANRLEGGRGNDFLAGGGGNDWLMPGLGNNTVDGGSGIDMVSYVDVDTAMTIDLGAGTATAMAGGKTDRLLNIENVTGTIHADLIIGDEGNNRLRGLGSYDWFVGSGGNDTYEGGDGRDTVSYANAPRTADGWGVEANLLLGRGLRGQAEGDIYDSIESLTGSSHNDWLAGDNDNNVLRGLGGDDIIFGYGGRDTIDGGPGNDYIHGGDGNDRITGGPGHDTIDGGWGWDVAVYSGRKADYIVTAQDDGWTSVYDRRGAGGDGYDLLINVEVLEFTDGKIYLA